MDQCTLYHTMLYQIPENIHNRPVISAAMGNVNIVPWSNVWNTQHFVGWAICHPFPVRFSTQMLATTPGCRRERNPVKEKCTRLCWLVYALVGVKTVELVHTSQSQGGVCTTSMFAFRTTSMFAFHSRGAWEQGWFKPRECKQKQGGLGMV